MTNTPQLLEDFKSNYPDKYLFSENEPLGQGSYGAVFKAIDVDRQIPVAIKIYHDGIVPLGSERGWIVTSKIINPQISPTYTIESFTSSDGKDCKAVVSRFIPGKSLKQIFDWANAQVDDNKRFIADDFVFSFLPSLLNILDLCHSLGFGHGDFTPGNIMATPTNIHEKYEFTATLIDFDNSSIEAEVYTSNEKEKIDKDCRAFSNPTIGIGPYIVMDWQWEQQVKGIFAAYSTIRDFKIAFDIILKYVDLVNKGMVNREKTLAIFKELLHYRMNGFVPKATIDSLREISTVAGLTAEFDRNLQAFEEMTRNYDNWSYEVTIIENGHIKNSLYKGFFG